MAKEKDRKSDDSPPLLGPAPRPATSKDFRSIADDQLDIKLRLLHNRVKEDRDLHEQCRRQTAELAAVDLRPNAKTARDDMTSSADRLADRMHRISRDIDSLNKTLYEELRSAEERVQKVWDQEEEGSKQMENARQRMDEIRNRKDINAWTVTRDVSVLALDYCKYLYGVFLDYGMSAYVTATPYVIDTWNGWFPAGDDDE